MRAAGDKKVASVARRQSPKVLHIAAGNLYGGVETMLASVARFNDDSPQMRHEFALCFPGRLQNELASQNATAHELPAPRLSRPWTVAKSRAHLRAILLRHQFVAVVTHGCWPLAVFGPTIKRSQAALIHYMHDNVVRRTFVDILAATNRPDVVLSNSRFTLSSAKELFPRSKHEVCYCLVAPFTASESDRQSTRRELGITDDRVVILQASRLESWKGHRHLIGALSKLRKQLRWECWIAGGVQRPHEAEYLAELRRHAANEGLTERIQFLGQRNDVRSLMAGADIFCQPNSGPEPFGIAYIEALYAGLPVVASQLGGAAEILSEGAGLLVPARDEHALANVLANLIEDSDLRLSFQDRGPKRASMLCEPESFFGQFARVVQASSNNA